MVNGQWPMGWGQWPMANGQWPNWPMSNMHACARWGSRAGAAGTHLLSTEMWNPKARASAKIAESVCQGGLLAFLPMKR